VQGLRSGWCPAPCRRLQGELHGDRRVGGDLLQDRLGTGDQISRGNNFVDEADAIGFLGRDRFAGEDQL
jgi:hypothetical protein